MKRNFKYLLSSFRLTDESMFELELATYGFVKSVECYSRVIMIFWCAPQSVFCPKFLTRGIDSYIHILKKKITAINFLLYKLLIVWHSTVRAKYYRTEHVLYL